MGRRDRFWDAPRRRESPIPGARERLEPAEYNDTKTNMTIAYDDCPILEVFRYRILRNGNGNRSKMSHPVPFCPIGDVPEICRVTCEKLIGREAVLKRRDRLQFRGEARGSGLRPVWRLLAALGWPGSLRVNCDVPSY
jgi:hypothetical protein